jgi:DNA polymerase elongation subunit (family B)
MELENVYAWFAFLNSRQNPNASVANKFYGIAENGDHKIRGIAERRGDTCGFVRNMQREVIEILAKEKDPAKLVCLMPEILATVQDRLSLLKSREIPLNELVITQALSRELNGYSVLSPVAVAATQLKAHGNIKRMGQKVRFIHVAPGGVHAWGLPAEPAPRSIDAPFYKDLAFRAVYEVLQPLGITEKVLKGWVFKQAGYVTPEDLTDPARQLIKQEFPIFANVEYVRLSST